MTRRSLAQDARSTRPARSRPSRSRVTPGGSEEQLFGEVDPPHPALLGLGQEEEAFVVVDRQPVLGHELSAHGTGGRGVPPEEADPGIQGRSLIGQYLTRQCFLATIACVLNYSLIKEECK